MCCLSLFAFQFLISIPFSPHQFESFIGLCNLMNQNNNLMQGVMSSPFAFI